MAGYFHYFSFGLSRYIDRLLVRVREDVYRIFLRELAPDAGDTILDVGVSADEHPASNHFEKRYPHLSRICALSIDAHPELRMQFPGITLVRGDARALPFASGAFDFVYSHAVVEHLGSRERQARFLREALRVARKGVLVTTPNRWHPVESHTGLPLLHFLPAPACRKLYRVLGKGMYATEESLNLLGPSDFVRLCGEIPATIHRVQWLGIASNLVLVVRKGGQSLTVR
jgi:hypothetical protein